MRSEGGAQSAIVESRELMAAVLPLHSCAFTQLVALLRAARRRTMNSTKKKHPHGHVGGHLGAKRKKDKPQKQPRAPKLHILACHGVGRVDLGFMYAHLADAYLGLTNKSRAEREAIAGERAARFATRFAPEALLRRAGVDALLRDLIARTSQKRST